VKNIVTVRFSTIFVNRDNIKIMRKKVKEMIDIIEADGWFFPVKKEAINSTSIQLKKGLLQFPTMAKMRI